VPNEPSKLSIATLGQLSIRCNDRVLAIAGRRARALIGYLALSEADTETRERLVGLLWSETEEEKARASLRQALHELRRTLGDTGFDGIAADKLTVRIDRARVAVDLWDVLEEAQAGRAHPLLLHSERLLERLLEDLETLDPAFRTWLLAKRQTLTERVRHLIETAMREEGKRAAEREVLARALMNLDPTHEEAARVRIRARAEAGDIGVALGIYKALWDLLDAEYDVEPSKETQELIAAIKLGQPLAGSDPRPAPQSSARPASTIAGPPGTVGLAQSTGAVLCIDLAHPAHGGKDNDMVARFATEISSRTGGRLAESRGRDVLLEFESTRAAAAAAFGLEERGRQLNEHADPRGQVSLRIGIEARDSLLGGADTAAAARLVAALAGAGEVVIGACARDRLTPVLDAEVEDLGDRRPGGGEALVRAYRIWQPNAPSRFSTAPQDVRMMPTIAVIPPAGRTASLEHDLLGEVVADEFIRSLSRSKRLDVISRLSTTAFRGRAESVAEIGWHLSADYVLSGVYRVFDPSIVIDLELSEARSQRVVWSERLKDSMTGLLHAEQSELVNRAVAGICKAIALWELERAHSIPLPTLESHTLLIAGITLMHRNSPRDFQTSRDMLQALVERAPRHAIPYAWLANWHVLRVQQGWSDDLSRDANLALDYARRSVDEDPACAMALAIDGFVHTNLLRRLDIALDRYDRAIEANPNEPLAWLLRGTLHAFRGEGDVAVENTQRALKLTPLDPQRYFYESLSATACLAAHQFDRALELADRSLRLNCNHTSTLRAKAIAEWQLGRKAAARSTALRLLELEPGLTTSGWLARSPSAPFAIGREWLETLREVGIPQ
jgi:DNA-binding SARP family transcriptional activator/TolB-like protein